MRIANFWKSRKLLISWLTLLTLGSFLGEKASADTITPNDFSDATTWIANIHGTGPSLSPHAGGFNAIIPARSTPNSRGHVLAEYDAGFLMGGDFDVQVDFSLVAWPSGGKVGASVAEFYGQDRISLSGEYYVFGAGGIVFKPTSDMSGQLRLVRDGSSFSGYAGNGGGGWTLIGSGSITQADLQLSLGTWNESMLNETVEVAFNNLVVTADSILALPADWWQTQTYRDETPFGIRTQSDGGATVIPDASSTLLLLSLGVCGLAALVVLDGDTERGTSLRRDLYR